MIKIEEAYIENRIQLLYQAFSEDNKAEEMLSNEISASGKGSLSLVNQLISIQFQRSESIGKLLGLFELCEALGVNLSDSTRALRSECKSMYTPYQEMRKMSELWK